jgi:Cu/Ag efflux protein CusF
MRILLMALLAAAVTVAMPACTPAPPAAEVPAASQATPPPAGPVRSRGIVQTVTREYNAITIQHEAIPEYDMPAMVMEFTVDDPAQLDGITEGDSVSFELRSGLDIAAIAKTETE